MSERNPRPLWPLLTAALVGLPVLYVASWLPAGWIYHFAMDHHWIVPGGPVDEIANRIYLPVAWLAQHGPAPIADALNWYAARPR